MPDPSPAPAERLLGVRLRPYQQRMLERFRAGLAAGKRRFHFVAPPGSGKTVMGIAMVLEAGGKACVFSPNAAIQGQWLDRFEASTAAVGAGGEGGVPAASTDPASAAAFLSLTYQSITVKAAGGDGLHANARRLLEGLAADGYRTLVFDECHHLTDHWGRVANELAGAVAGSLVIGLTATPPVDRGRRELATYLDVVGEIDDQVPLPAIVKEGNLAPYQDLVYFTRPEAGEVELLLDTERIYRELLAALEAPEPPVRPLSTWVEGVLESCRPGGRTVPFDEWLRDDPDRAIAYVRYLRRTGMAVPASVLWIDEMDDPLQIDDLALVVQDYLAEHLAPRRGREHPLAKQAKEAFAALGYAWAGKQFQATTKGAAEKLLFSRSKLGAMREILRAEAAWMLDDLRALVLADYEYGRRDVDGFTVLDAMRVLTSDPELDALQPILVTGSSVLIDDDLRRDFESRAAAFLARRGLSVELAYLPEEGYLRVEGRGRDWSTTTWVALVTELLDAGVTRCLVGTRALLGEGWDSLSLNTLVDLTAVSSYVSVNQIRGRTLRKDPARPEKCADNWDVVAVLPGLGYGLHDFLRLEKKHAQLYGVAEDGAIEKGLGHVHPWLSRGSHERLGAHLDALNAEMLGRARKRFDAAARWQVGKPYRGADALCLELSVPEDVPDLAPPPPAGRVLAELDRADAVRLEIVAGEALRAWLMRGWYLLVPWLLAVLHAAWERRRVEARLALPAAGSDLATDLRPFAEAVLGALEEAGLAAARGPGAIRVQAREGGYVRLLLDGAGPEESERFAEAVYELLGPVQDHRYLVERREPVRGLVELGWAGLRAGPPPTRVAAVHPVPSVLGRRREHADVFQRHWNRLVAPGEVVYARSEAGKALAAAWFRRRTFALRRERKRVWA